MDAPPLHERAFPDTLPRKRGPCQEAIGIGLANHCWYSSSLLHYSPISSIRKSGGRAASQIRICSWNRIT